jgi:Tfp pilus assembly protein PilZ
MNRASSFAKYYRKYRKTGAQQAESESADEMIQKAGIAAHFAEEQNLLYSAYNKNFDNNSVKRLTLLGTMKEALMADELILFLRPKEWSQKKYLIFPGKWAVIRPKVTISANPLQKINLSGG